MLDLNQRPKDYESLAGFNEINNLRQDVFRNNWFYMPRKPNTGAAVVLFAEQFQSF